MHNSSIGKAIFPSVSKDYSHHYICNSFQLWRNNSHPLSYTSTTFGQQIELTFHGMHTLNLLLWRNWDRMQFLPKEFFFSASTSLPQWEKKSSYFMGTDTYNPHILSGAFYILSHSVKRNDCKNPVDSSIMFRLLWTSLFQFSSMLETNMNILLLVCIVKALENGDLGQQGLCIWKHTPLCFKCK